MGIRNSLSQSYLLRGLWKEAIAAGDKCSLSTRIAAYCFSGAFELGEALYHSQQQDTLPQIERIMCRFFLSITAIRRSEFSKADHWQSLNRKEKKPPELGKFYCEQGDLFRDYYAGHLPAALAKTELVLPLARKSKDPFALILALDALGHVQVRNGKLHSGLALLEEAKEIAKKAGNQNFYETIDLSQLLYRSEFSLDQHSLQLLRERWRDGGPANSFAPVSLGLELARQLTLRGVYSEARSVLEGVAPLLYQSGNRRQEIILNLRFAELSYRQGDDFLCRHFLEFARRLLTKEPDQSLALPLFGLEKKIGLKLDDLKWGEINKVHGSARDTNLRYRLGLSDSQNPEDRFHALLLDPGISVEELLTKGVLGFAADKAGVARGSPTLLLTSKGVLAADKSGLSYLPLKLTTLQWKFLGAFSARATYSKAELVRLVWGYQYHPLRHDSLLYGLVHGIRKHLGDIVGQWLAVTEDGYSFRAKVITPKAEVLESIPRVAPSMDETPKRIDLNPRQWMILKLLKEKRFLGTADCQSKFGVSEVTAFRDLHGLCQMGLVSKMGKARATRYCLLDSKGRN